MIYSYITDTCHFQKIADESTANTEFDFHWNSVPTDIGNNNNNKNIYTYTVKEYYNMFDFNNNL